ncbi:hypothetical protein QJS10_CPA07g00488 [Acorus calamus]|uniref:Uncharacterized protein n=1 Tax=Acorus calamus TaxID=4465 RepID=A0AAV9EDX5_ACOCL|nr:hypothetical protein QJS10_CPA07g00488 [Acorus calamus]
MADEDQIGPPPDGVVVKHIKTGDDLRVLRRVIAKFFSDQIFRFQDLLFENIDGHVGFIGNYHEAIGHTIEEFGRLKADELLDLIVYGLKIHMLIATSHYLITKAVACGDDENKGEEELKGLLLECVKRNLFVGGAAPSVGTGVYGDGEVRGGKEGAEAGGGVGEPVLGGMGGLGEA